MKKIYTIAIFPLLLAGCKDPVPEVQDVNNIVIKGKQYQAVEYVREFCQDPANRGNENCIKVEKKMLADQTRFINIKPDK